MKMRGTITIPSVLAAALGAFTLGACASRQAAESLSTQVENPEHRSAQHADTERRLAHIEAQSAQIIQLVEAMTSRLDSLDRRLATLAAQQARATAPQRPLEPDPTVVYAVSVGDSPVEGPADAKITIVESFEFACPFSERARATLAELRRHYGKDVRIVYKHFIVHPSMATIPAQAACAAHVQSKFTAMKDAIWEHGFNAGRNLSEENMLHQARKLGLDMRRFEADMRGPCVRLVQQDHTAMAGFGVVGTPASFINGRYLSGAQPFENFRRLVDQELARADEIIRTQRVEPREYYESQVMARGRKER